jgi:hypothetical protein
MPTHWTYDVVAPDADLAQGDILVPTDELRAVFEQVHRHFLDPKYTGFLVTTQSCDLVRRRRGCSTRYLTIAVVRQLDDVLHDLLAHICDSVAEGVYLQETKGDATRFLQRLFNQNEQSLGLFYLHKDADAGIAVPSVALLRVGVTLRAEHYQLLVQSRRGRLGPEFTAKLGWLVGNLFSRVGTPDWSKPPERETQLESLIKETLDADGSEAAPLWVRGAWVAAAKENGCDLANLPKAELRDALQKHKPPAAKDRVIERALEVVGEVIDGVATDDLKRISARLSNDQLFAKALKSAKTE